MTEPLIVLKNVTIGYGRPLMRPLALEIRRGEFWGLVGPNGAGKTTLVRTILGIVPPVSGALMFPEGRPRFGYVPQRHVLNRAYPLTALDVALMGRYDRLRLGQGPSDEDRKRAADALDRMGLADLASRRYARLSGGQQQKALMARALASDPDVLILDEPTTGMDLPGEFDILSFLKRLQGETRITIVMIGHHLDSVASVADHLCFINKDDDLFEAGSVEAMLDADRLSGLYGRRVTTSRHDAGWLIRAEEERHG